MSIIYLIHRQYKMKKITKIDLLIQEVQHGLNTCFTRPSASRAYPAEELPQNELNSQETKHSAALMRINNAGEVAAQGLYRGQAITAKSKAVYDNMVIASIEENDHLNWCQTRLEELHGHRSLLDPIWYIGSLKMGIIAGLFGDKWSLGFVEETEKQVGKHLQEHLNQLPEYDLRSKAVIEKMKSDELQHAISAKKAGAAPLPTFIQQAMKLVSKVMTKSSYHI